ncbi:type I restriction endonuclease, partial [Mycobacterium innocens]|uniref:type I restriction endonuclease n=1 Tax=Mycobacterium innocens TaxID=2341083 RepID=UPI001FC964E5
MALHNEIEFEKEFAEHLAAHGWLYSPNDTGYDRERALFPEDILGWLTDTQPEQLAKVVKPGSGDIAKQQTHLLGRIVKVLDTPLDNGGGTLNLLRKGFSHLAAKFQMCVFKPESTLNEKRNADYAAVRVRVMRQAHFSTADQRSVDLVFFVNGLPVATAELKTDFTQSLFTNGYAACSMGAGGPLRGRPHLGCGGAPDVACWSLRVMIVTVAHSTMASWC